MNHVAVDVGGKQSQVCIRSARGKILSEARCETRTLGTLFSQMAPARVILETCAESRWLAQAALDAGHEVRVVPGTLVKALGVGSRRTKTDRRDAQMLSEASCRMDLPSVHLNSAPSRERKTMLSMRDGLVQSRTMLINTVRGWMRTVAGRCRSGGPETFADRVRKAMKEMLPACVERQLQTIEHLNGQIAEAARELEQVAESDPICKRLMSVPGVGPVTSVAFVATLDDVARFESAAKAGAYLGLAPGEDSSSDRQRRTSITKAGSSRMRWLLVQAAWSMRRIKKADPAVLWSKEVEKRRGKRIAVVALARKLAGILFALWRDGAVYDPHRGAAMLAA